MKSGFLVLCETSKEIEDEQGVNVLFLALGFLRWFEDASSDIVREAPLILVPVLLTRDNARGSIRLKAREGDIETNFSLVEKVKDFNLGLPELPDDEDWLPSEYLDRVRAAVSSQSRWSVDSDGALLGFFSFSKLLMYRDLDPDNWPGATIFGHRILDGLFRGFHSAPLPLPENAKLDQSSVDTCTLPQVVDADGSQTVVIEAARAGRDLVVKGPPGTGKSQTITNIVAAAVREGKTVLFVAEKMAALNVVHDRLKQAGLETLCLELHSRHATRKAVAEALERALVFHVDTGTNPADIDQLRNARDALNSATDLLHRPLGSSGVTPFQALAEQVRYRDSGTPVPTIEIPESVGWPPGVWDRLIEQARDLAELAFAAGSSGNHPWRGVCEAGLQPVDQQRLQLSLAALLEAGGKLATRVAVLATKLGQERAASLSQIDLVLDVLGKLPDRPEAEAAFWEIVASAERLERLIEIATIGIEFRSARDEISPCFTPVALDREVSALRPAIASGGTSLFARLRSRYRAASRELGSLMTTTLPKTPHQRLALLNSLIRARKLAADLAAEAGYAAAALNAEWRGDKTDFSLIRDAARWLSGLNGPSRLDRRAIALARGEFEYWRTQASALSAERADFARILDNVIRTLQLDLSVAFGVSSPADIPLHSMFERASAWQREPERLHEWLLVRRAAGLVRAAAGPAVSDWLTSAPVAPGAAVDGLRYARAEALWRAAVTDRPGLTLMTDLDRNRLVTRFRELEHSRRGSVTREILHRYQTGRPSGGFGEMGVIRGEIARRRGHLSVRALIRSAGTTIQRLKPVFLMSPLSVAQFLAPGSITFDLLLIDEASQVRPEDALGAIARARQIVVVGDRKQLPPTAFFDRKMNADGADEDQDEEGSQRAAAFLTDIESIHQLCEARGLPAPQLRWHYRSRHPSLIAVSNAEFYGDDLFMPPSPSRGREAEGLTLTRVQGSYDRGGKRTNQIEAEAVIAAVRKHARETPGQSLGVVTFSAAQKALLDDLIEAARRDDPALEAFSRRSGHEEFFVKNFENVQGDERDVIFVSIGYGPRMAGSHLDNMGFGPVSAPEGERRLNVLFTRAKWHCRIFVSFGWEDIDLTGPRNDGARILQRFLRFATTGVLDQPIQSGDDPDSPFEVSVANAIREMGYVVDLQVGSAKFRIDLAVHDPEHPGRYLLAVECDGASYHSAQWARERDRLRQEVLEGLGWRFHRIWSTDWFRAPQQAKAKLLTAITRARVDVPRQPSNGSPPPPLPAPLPASHPKEVRSDPAVPRYKVASFDTGIRGNILSAPLPSLMKIVVEVVRTEGPIHGEELVSRVTHISGGVRTGTRISGRVKEAIANAATNSTIRQSGPFWYPTDPEWKVTLRDRSEAPPSVQRPDHIPTSEIALAIEEMLRSNGGVSAEEVPVAAARLLGFRLYW